MEITSVDVHRKESDDTRMKANVSVTIDNGFVVHGIRVIEGREGLFVAMPSRKTSTGQHRDIAHPISKEVRKMFEDAILEAYNNSEIASEE